MSVADLALLALLGARTCRRLAASASAPPSVALSDVWGGPREPGPSAVASSGSVGRPGSRARSFVLVPCNRLAACVQAAPASSGTRRARRAVGLGRVGPGWAPVSELVPLSSIRISVRPMRLSSLRMPSDRCVSPSSIGGRRCFAGLHGDGRRGALSCHRAGTSRITRTRVATVLGPASLRGPGAPVTRAATPGFRGSVPCDARQHDPVSTSWAPRCVANWLGWARAALSWSRCTNHDRKPRWTRP